MRIARPLGFLLSLLPFLAQAQTSTNALLQVGGPAPAQAAPILVRNAELHIGDGNVVRSGSVLFDKGKIVSVGPEPAQLPAGTRVVDAQGRRAYPGMVLANNSLGLSEIEAVRAGNDRREVGTLNPNARAFTAYNPASQVIPTVRANGVLTVHTVPEGGLVSGTSALVQLDAWQTTEAALVRDLGIHVHYPARNLPGGWWAEPGPSVPNEARPGQLQQLEELFNDARDYARNLRTRQSQPRNLRLEAMAGLFDGRLILFLHAGSAREIVEAVQFGKRHAIDRLVVQTGTQAVKVAGFLRDNNVPVILNRLHSLPAQTDEDYDLPYRAPALLRQAGVLFCLDMSGDQEVQQGRNLGMVAGTAMGYGLTEEQAVEAVTFAPARILGVDNRLGRLAPGLDATLILTDGPLTDIRTGKVRQAFIQGREIDLDNKHKALYRTYANRYGQTVVE